jgi:hypothetical protein
MTSPGMLHRMALVRTDVSEEHITFIIWVTIVELGTTLAVNSKPCSVHRFLVTATVLPSSPILVTLMKEALSSSESRFLQESLGVTSQKTPFFIVTAVKTSNLT